MGCCFGKEYISKETFNPTPDLFADCPEVDTPNGGDKAEVKAEALKKEVALNILLDQKLEMVKEDTGFIGAGGTKLYLMRNVLTKDEGLVQADSVAKVGTVECEK